MTTLEPGTKLCLITKDKEVSYVDNMVLTRWEDLTIIHVKGVRQGNQDLEATLFEYIKNLGIEPPPLVILGDEIDIEIYGVRPEKKAEVSSAQLQLDLENAG